MLEKVIQDLPFICAMSTQKTKKVECLDKDQFIDKVPEEIMCVVCSKISLSPLVCSSCHKFSCKKCLDKARGFTMIFTNKHNYSCPSCCANTIEKPSKTVLRKIWELQIKCKNSLCPKLVEFIKLHDHMKECCYEQVECASKRCKKIGLKKDFLSFVYTPCLLYTSPSPRDS